MSLVRDLRLGWGALRTVLGAGGDATRWARATEHDAEWDARARALAALVPDGASVIEFGAGPGGLGRFLAPGCRYSATDLVPRAGVAALDLDRRPLPVLPHHDLAAFAGVLEYLRRPDELPAWLAGFADGCILSYNAASTRPRTPARALERLRRARAGWASTLSERELCAAFAAAGYALVRRTQRQASGGATEPLFEFRREPR
jgi:hypothetical protein